MTLCLRNRQRVCPIDLRLFRRILRYVLQEHFDKGDHELCFHFVEAGEIARVHEEFLEHVGPTDVITFDQATEDRTLRGEIFICPEVAVAQAKQHRTSWQSELVRYAIHGLLHLQGHDDKRAESRRKMKREEDRLLNEVAKRFAIARLQRTPLK